MPAPTEKEILSSLLDALNDDKKTNKNHKIQKWLISLAAIGLVVTVFLGYKFFCMSRLYLIVFSSLAGMAFTAFIILTQTKNYNSLLKPYINTSAMQARIDELSET